MPCPYCNSPKGFIFDGDVGACVSCWKSSSLADWKTPPVTPTFAASIGEHGFKKKEQKVLGTSGTTHESEHAIGYDVLGKGLKRGESASARHIENRAPAYQEYKPDHRDHIGTSTHSDYKNTHESSEDYRKTQRALVKKRRASDAIQINQEYYSHQPGFQTDDDQRRKADESFRRMVENVDEFPYWDADQRRVKRARFDAAGKAEMNLARITARSGVYPDRKAELDQMKKFGLLPGASEKLPRTGPGSIHGTDIHGIRLDGNCLFHSIWEQLYQHLGAAMIGATIESLRQQAIGFLRMDPEVAATGVATAAYLDIMARDGTWGGEPEIMALAHVWGVRITVIAPGYNITYNAASTGAHLTLHYNGVDHYSVGAV